MEYITKKDLIDCSTPDEFCFSLCCMECKTVWKSTPIRFSRAGKKPENENRKIIYDTLYEREKNLAFQKALNQAKEITNSHIMVAGSMAVEDEGTKIVVYDYDGNQLLKLGGEDISSPDKLGSITGMAETENGFVAADGNMREIQFWAKDGTHVGAISTEDIFGVSYPWLEDMQLLDDGSLLIMLTQERDDGSANELMFFRLTGF